ncbi:hypothetical protein QVD17_10516 [Tagetes erecta]|uniref:H15 domain-containing protein n=1 Tax=Tagetes erecta TaxID=13708 RepID=A0AAD8L192_TARER|nr:hypothetical protein QVD17_10516 [Tagetes erecta]
MEEPVVVAQAIEAAATVVIEKEPAVEGKSTKLGKQLSTKRKTKMLHPPYFDMIKDAILSLKERTGSSQYAIAKFIKEKQENLPVKFKTVLLIQLRRLVAIGKLVKVKASYKLPAAKPKPAAKSKPTPKAATKPKQGCERKPVLKTKAGENLADKTKGKTPTKPAKVARTSTRSTPGKKPAPAQKPVSRRLKSREVSGQI